MSNRYVGEPTQQMRQYVLIFFVIMAKDETAVQNQPSSSIFNVSSCRFPPKVGTFVLEDVGLGYPFSVLETPIQKIRAPVVFVLHI